MSDPTVGSAGELLLGDLRVPEKDIIAIVQDQPDTASTSPSPSPNIPSTASPGTYTLTWLSELSDAEHPFALHTQPLPAAAVAQLPADLARHVLTKVPATLLAPLHVVVSTRSGTCQAQAFYDGALAPLMAVLGLHSGDYNLVITDSPRSVAELARSLLAGTPPPTVILLSGDGGVVDLLNGVGLSPDKPDDLPANPDHLPAIALLPLGTGNALFHSLHRLQYVENGPSPLVLGLRTLLRGRPAPLPSFEAAFSPGARVVSENAGLPGELPLLRGAIVASYGFHAQLVWESDTPEYRRHGAKRFGMAAEQLLQTAHVYAADVATVPPAERPLADRTYVLATLVSNLERTFTISPASRPLDGQLRLVHLGAIGADRTMQVMMAAYRDGAHVGMRWTGDDGREEAVGYAAIDELAVTVHEADSRWRKVCIDGTIVELPRDGWMRVRRAAQPVLRVVV